MNGVGIVDKIWIGHATNQTIRLNSSSGGIVTGSLVALLESGFIDGAVVNVADPTFVPNGKSIFAKTMDELMQSSKSIYCMTEISRGLNVARYDDDIKRIAVVGLPCQISKLRRMLDEDDVMQRKVVICFGIMCGHNMQSVATVKALEESGINVVDVKKVTYRAHGWYPFNYTVEMNNGIIKDFAWAGSPLQKMWDSLKYMPPICKRCSDFAAESADIACCDAWLDRYRGTQEGYSIVLTHTKLGTDVIEDLINKGALKLGPGAADDLYRSNYLQIDRKLAIKEMHNE